MRVPFNQYTKELGITKDTYWLTKDQEKEKYANIQEYYENEDGIIPAETWNLDFTLSTIIYSYLRYFRDHSTYSIPTGYKELVEWHDDLDKMIDAFALVCKGDPEFTTYTEYSKELDQRSQKIEEGLNLFAIHFRDLWD